MSGRARAGGIRLCPRCQRDLEHDVGLARPSLSRAVLRAPAKGMVKEDTPSPAVAKQLRRAERKSELRKKVREGDWLGAVTLFRVGRTEPPPPEECPDCQALNSPALAA